MNTPNYERKVCDAVLRVLEKRTRESRTDIRFPEEDLCGPPVDLRVKLGATEYAIEHTRIEPFENQIKTALIFNEIKDHVNARLAVLPGVAHYQLHIPNDVRLPEKKELRTQALDNLVEWIQESTRILHERCSRRIVPIRSPHWSDDQVTGKPEGFACTFEFLRWPYAELIRRNPGSLWMGLFCPREYRDLDVRRYDRLKLAFSRKFPKLQECKAAGARTVIVLENRDSFRTRFDQFGNALPELLAEQTSDAPDEIFLVETESDPWWVYLSKKGDDHWPTYGMPRWGQPIYEPGKTPGTGVPKRIRDALRLDEVYAPHPADWCPAIFDKDDLINLKSAQTSKARWTGNPSARSSVQ